MAASSLSDSERALYESVKKGNADEARRLLSLGGVKVDCLDEHGMTPLMQAAYKGDVDMCELLLAHGADVNSNFHEHQYTCLMFACLSGSADCTRLLLEVGARVTAVNNVGRTAGQLGAFVGRHECVSLINVFIPVEDIEYYSRPQGLEKEGKLPKQLVQSVHRLCVIINLNPVKIVMHLREHEGLLANYQTVYKVLQLHVERCIKRKDMNELMAMKLHYISCVVKSCGRWRDELEGKGGVEGFLKYLIRGRPSDGFPLGTEDLIRQSIKDFEFPDCVIFKQLVNSIGPVEKGNDPTAITVLTQAINGLHSADFSNCCVVCGEGKVVKKCAGCKVVTYCAVTCQKLHWPTHKKHCKKLAKQYEEAQRAVKMAAEEQEREEKEKTVQNGVGEKLKKEEEEGDKTQDTLAEDEQKPKTAEQDMERAAEEKEDEIPTLNPRGNQLSENHDGHEKEKHESISSKSESETHKDDKQHNERTDNGEVLLNENENHKKPENEIETS